MPCLLRIITLADKIHAEDEQAFVIARINCDVEQQIVNHFGVQSVPSVFMFIDGKGADGFAGEQTEQFIREFINKHTPDQSVLLLEQGKLFLLKAKLNRLKQSLYRHYN